MPEYTGFLGLYKPNRNDNLSLDTTLADNFDNIDKKLGSGLVGNNGETHASLKERLDQENTESLNLIKDNAYYNGVNVRYERDSASNTDYVITTIKHKDENGKIIPLKRGFAENDPSQHTAETAREFANRNNATLTLNASTFDSDPYRRRSTDIFEGQSLSGDPVYHRWELGVLSDNTLKAYPPRTPVSELLSDGVVHSFAGFCPFIIDGEQQLSDYYIGISANSYEQHPRNAIAQMENKDIVILTCDGRSETSEGMTIEDMARILTNEGVQFAYNLDGGGSAQTVVRGSLVTRPIDSDGLEARAVPDFIYFSKDIVTPRDQDLAEINEDVGDVRMLVEHAKRDLAMRGNLPQRIGQNDNWDRDRPSDLNDITVSGFYWGHSTTTANTPKSGVSWGILHFHYGSASDAMQVAFPFSTDTSDVLSLRRTSGGSWSDWRAL
jgi:hypothetical protein